MNEKNERIESTFVSAGVAWEYEAWFEYDSGGKAVASVRGVQPRYV